LGFNAPHEPVSAPEDLIEEMRLLYPESPISRLEYLAAVRAIDIEVERIVTWAEKLKRETIVILQSDNGGSLASYGSGNNDGERACNYPFRGYKNTLFEGGTLSPTILYSTKRKLKNRVIRSQFHIIDWFPTLLDFAGYNRTLPDNLDGVNQRMVFEERDYEPLRTKFIYGVVNEFSINQNEWNTMFTVRYGKYKYSNFLRNAVGNFACLEGFANAKYMDELSVSTRMTAGKDEWKRYRQRLRDVTMAVQDKDKKDNKRQPGHALFDLSLDPFEINNLNENERIQNLPKDSEESKFYQSLLQNITHYVHGELRKGFQYPITGKLRNGNLLKTIISNGFDFHSRLEFMLTTGRLVKLAPRTRRHLKGNKQKGGPIGVLGNQFCPAFFDNHILKELYIDALFTENEKLAFCIKLYLEDSVPTLPPKK